MNIQEYISSGILESYVLGALSKVEAAEVESMASKNPEVKEEIRRIEEGLFKYAEAHAVSPKPELKNKILKKIRVGENTGEAKVISLTKKNQIAEYLAAASISIAILSAGAAYYFYDKWQKAQDTILAMEMQNSVLTERGNTVNYNMQKELEATNKQLSMLMDTITAKIILKGMPVSPSSQAAVYWNKNSRDVMIAVANLPAPPSDKQYQLWALKDGKPVDAGVFEIKSDMQQMKNIDGAQAFAVTLEKKGGSSVPTLEALYLMGEI